MDITENILLGIQVNEAEAQKAHHWFDGIARSLFMMKHRTEDMNKGWKKFNPMFLTAAMTLKMVGNAAMSLLQPALEATGVFDYFGAVLMDFFMPIIEPVADILFGIGDFFTNLPDSIKLVVGAFVLLVAAVGLILGPLAFLATGWTAVVTFLTVTVPGAIASFLLSLTPLGWALLILIAIVALVWLAWSTNFGNMKEWIDKICADLLNIFNGFVQAIKGIFEMIWGIITGNPEMIKKGFQDLVNGIIAIWGGLKNLGGDLIGWIIDTVKATGHLIYDALCGIPIIGPLLKMILDAGMAVVGGAFNLIAGAFGHGGYISGDKDYVTKQGLLYEGTGGQGTNNYAPNISINANINNSMDIRALGDQLNEYMYNEYRRLR